MIDTSALTRKNKSLKLAIERYNAYKKFVDLYKSTKSLNAYAAYIRATETNMNEGLVQYYESLIRSYESGNFEPLLSHLYDRLLAADEHKTKVSNELKMLLKELWEYNFKM